MPRCALKCYRQTYLAISLSFGATVLKIVLISIILIHYIQKSNLEVVVVSESLSVPSNFLICFKLEFPFELFRTAIAVVYLLVK